MAKTTNLHEITRVTDNAHNTSCTFCGTFIFHETRHYDVVGIGAMCVSCVDRSYLTFKDRRSYVTLTYTMRASRPHRLI
jgi:predicted SprT family Zn-dependent metalloprotease